MADPTSTTSTAEAASTTILDDDRPHDDLILEFNVIIWLLTGISGAILFVRAYCKITRQRGLWWDDWIMFAAWVRFWLYLPLF